MSVGVEKRRWADAHVDDDDEFGNGYIGELPPPTSRTEGNTKVTTEYLYDGKLKAVNRHYKIEKIKVSKSVAMRKQWQKFGKAKTDPPGPNPSTTVCCDDVQMQFISNKEEDKLDSQRDPEVAQLLDKSSVVKCRNCGMEHWTLKCPYKEKFEQMIDADTSAGPSTSARSDVLGGSKDDKKAGGKYVPPSMREGAKPRDNVYSRSGNEANTIRVTNLPEDIQDSDIKDLISPLIKSKMNRIFLAKDKWTGQSKGFAFVSFDRKEDAQTVIRVLNGFGYANLILNVEWAKPSTG